MMTLATVRRTKEVGVRKVLGATTPIIALLLSKHLFGVLLLSNLIAWPISYFAIQNWLQNFAYRIGQGIESFVAGGTFVLVIALMISIYQAIRASQTNPIDALRDE